ncbi:hypothetical protein BP5796_08229 [Coleophoma crateriformis]|uniref:AB hydrolase-1 domain-containing protein n=1 Tax=Coleophoma crateriformis TaxID=565419 RepID=A0A3D8RDS7_9HELO|nr:hypothetical protein BP5796_08229 [Coleophoma crateriformis]
MSSPEKQTLLVQHNKLDSSPATVWSLGRRVKYAMVVLLTASTYLLFGNGSFDTGAGSTSSLKWEPCGEVNKHKLECTRIDVPMDQFNKSASDKTFSIPLVRLLATNTSATGGKSIVLNPGGPGGSGAEFIWRRGEQLNKIIGEGFHLLGFDPRGVNGSIPQASCFVSPEQREEKIFETPWEVEFEAGDMFTRAENQVKACSEVTGEHSLYINTPQTAADMNSILDAIGQEEMYYWGFSYGTTLGQTYAQLFPERVTRLIIDGVSNLDDWYNSFVDEEDLVDTDKCYSEFVRHCFDAKENCPLNSIKDVSFKTANDLKTYIDDFLEALDEEPIPVYLGAKNYGAVTRRGVATNGVFSALYKPTPMWSVLAKNLAQLLSGNATAAYQAYTDLWVSKVLADETNTFVVQNDNWKTGANAPEHGIKPLQNLTMSLPEVSKLVSRYMGSDIYARASWDLPTTHDFHPRYHPEFPRVKTAHPILVLSTTYDPVCPLISAKKAHNSFEGAGFVEQHSTGHCSVSMPSLCTAKHVQRYFYDGILPQKGATCEIDGEYFPAPGSSVEAQSQLGEDDAKLLQALQELAAIGINDVPRF